MVPKVVIWAMRLIGIYGIWVGINSLTADGFAQVCFYGGIALLVWSGVRSRRLRKQKNDVHVLHLHVTDPDGTVHGFVRDREGRTLTWCGRDAGSWDVLVGGEPTCQTCDMSHLQH